MSGFDGKFPIKNRIGCNNRPSSSSKVDHDQILRAGKAGPSPELQPGISGPAIPGKLPKTGN
jgi:hypothetical protein